MPELARGVLFWLPWFLVPELVAVFWDGCPWPTLSGTVWDLIRSYPAEAGFVTLALVTLYAHFIHHRSVWWLVGVGLAGALAYALHAAL